MVWLWKIMLMKFVQAFDPLNLVWKTAERSRERSYTEESTGRNTGMSALWCNMRYTGGSIRRATGASTGNSIKRCIGMFDVWSIL